MFREQRKRIEAGTIFAAVVALATIAFVAVLAYRATRVDIEQTGLDDGAELDGRAAGALEVKVTFESRGDARAASLSFDGEGVEEPTIRGATMVWRPSGELAEGEHRLALAVPRAVIDDAHFTWHFTVDLTPPTLEVPRVVEAVAIDAPAEVKGRAEAGSRVRADGEDVDVDDDGNFTLSYTRAPAGPIALEAVDERRQRHRRIGDHSGDLSRPARRSRERSGVGERATAQRHPPPGGRGPDRHRSARSQGRPGRRRLRHHRRARSPDRGRDDVLRPRRRRPGAAGPRRSGDRPGRRVPRSNPRPGRLGGGRDQPGDPIGGGRPLRRSRPIHQLRRSRGAPLQPRHRAGCGQPGRRRHPLGRHPPTRWRPGRHGDPRADRLAQATRSPGSWPKATASSAGGAPIRA